MVSMVPPSTGSGVASRRTASTTMPPAMMNSTSPLPKATQHLQALEAIGALAVRRPAGEAEGEPGKEQPGKVGEHVPGIGEQRQRAGDQPAGRLDHHEDRR